MDAITVTCVTDSRRRRGVLLLVVLSMLTLFMMLGVSYIVVATRARKSARAFANNVVAATTAGVADQALLDQAFLTVVRGSTLALTGSNQERALGSGPSGGESLLGDKYGSPTVTSGTPTTVGRVTGAALFQSGSAFIQLSTASLTPTPTNPSDVVGRVVTLSLPGLVASTRIVQASGAAGSPSIVIPAGPTVSGQQLSVSRITTAIANIIGSGSGSLIINGREFSGITGSTNEAWDGVDARNPLLPGLSSEDSNGNGILDSGEDTNGNGVLDVNLIVGPSTIGTGSTLPAVDNDADGVADSRFVDIGLPPIVAADGSVLLPRAAILVADLDGRLNLNVHGTGSDESTYVAAGDKDMYRPVLTVAGGTSVPLYQLPRGLGTGPAEVSLDRSRLFGADPATNGERLGNATLALSGSASLTENRQDNVTKRYIPRIQNVDGRFGDTVGGASPRPGVSGTSDQWSTPYDQWRCSLTGSNTAAGYFTSPGRFGSPPDLKGLLKVWVDDTGQPVYYRPGWTGDSGSSVLGGSAGNEAIDDPYEVNLTRSAVRGGVRSPSAATTQPADSLFTPAELEGVLRSGDPDTMKLSRRLVALSGTLAFTNRLAVTTESWDTPAIPGDAWQQVINTPFATFLNTTGLSAPKRPQDLFSPETLQGHRFDLNRPFHDAPNYDEPNDATGTARRQAFARQLYCLLVAIARKNGTINPTIAEQLAQYAINVVDFRDADSIMTQFKYDPNFTPGSTGWNPGTNDHVWGCERPEILITETWAWHNRRTEDLPVGQELVDMPANTADDDFDQQKRPQGAFFVELYSPWASAANRYHSAGSGTNVRVTDATKPTETLRAEPLPAEFAADEDANGNGTLDSGEDKNGNGKLDMRRWRDSSINLSGSAPSSSPIWRLVTVRGTAAFGTDPVNPAATSPTLSILDPSRPGSTVPIDRAFYFATPSTAIQTSTGSNSAFWQQTAGGKSPNHQTYVVVGTDAPFNPLASGTAAADVRILKGAGGQPATITEPLAATDPYDVLMQAAAPGNAYTAPSTGNGNLGSWASSIDQPLDADTTPPAGITSSPFLSGANPQLMINGTHDNFAVVHLQRLADPTKAWNATTNPYLTVDSMTVDLTVVNVASTGGNNLDEPGTTGATPLTYLQSQKQYGRTGALTSALSTERGGKLSQLTGTVKPAHDIWSATVDASDNPVAVDDAESFRTATCAARAATPVTPGVPKGTLAPTPIAYTEGSSHTLQKSPERFTDTSDPANPKTYSFAWLFFPNRPFVSATELAFVPAMSPANLLRWHTLGQGQPRPFAHLTGFFESADPVAPWAAISGRSAAADAADYALWHFVHVPSPYAGVYANVPNPTSTNATALAELGLDIFPIRHGSSFREPGRINVNTIADGRTWRGLFGAVPDRSDKPDPTTTTTAEPAAEKIPRWKPGIYMTLTSGSAAATPRKSQLEILQSLPKPGTNTPPVPQPAGFLDEHLNEDKNGNNLLDSEDVNGNGVLDPGEDSNGNGVLDDEDANDNDVLDKNDYRDTDRNAYFRYQTMTRLSNSVTTRSNVFAVWVTIGYFEVDPITSIEYEVQPVRRHRAFYIFDRSIPVGYEPGKNHNVLDAVLLRRIIQ